MLASKSLDHNNKHRAWRVTRASSARAGRRCVETALWQRAARRVQRTQERAAGVWRGMASQRTMLNARRVRLASSVVADRRRAGTAPWRRAVQHARWTLGSA